MTARRPPASPCAPPGRPSPRRPCGGGHVPRAALQRDADRLHDLRGVRLADAGRGGLHDGPASSRARRPRARSASPGRAAWATATTPTPSSRWSAGSEQKRGARASRAGGPNFNSESFDVGGADARRARRACLGPDRHERLLQRGRAGPRRAGTFTVPPRPSLDPDPRGPLRAARTSPRPTPTPSPSPPQVSLTVRPATVAADGETDRRGRLPLRGRQGQAGGRRRPRVEGRPPSRPRRARLAREVGPHDGRRRHRPRPVQGAAARGAQHAGDRRAEGARDRRRLPGGRAEGEQDGHRSPCSRRPPPTSSWRSPACPKSRLPIRIGSLNGSIRGTLNLRASHLPNSPVTSREALNDATVSLESPMLTWAAIEKATSDEKGRFTIAMKMTNWPRWDLSLREAVLVDPDEEFTARQKRLTLGARAVAGLARRQAAGARPRLRRAGPARAPQGPRGRRVSPTSSRSRPGCSAVLKDGRGDAGDGRRRAPRPRLVARQDRRRVLLHRLAAREGGRREVQALEKAAGVRDLKAKKAQWVKSLADKSGVRDSLFGWLAKVVLSRAPTSPELESGRALPALAARQGVPVEGALRGSSDFVAEKVTGTGPGGRAGPRPRRVPHPEAAAALRRRRATRPSASSSATSTTSGSTR